MKWETSVSTLLGIKYPIIQGGLAYLAYSDLAAAVSNAGGLGQITAMSLSSPEALREEIKRVKAKTDKPFAVNLAFGVHNRPYEQMLEVAIEENVSAISMTGGNPAPILERLRDTNIKKLVLVAAVRQAQKAASLGADAVMVVGQEGGGHIGRSDVGTMVLVPQVVDAVDIPVIASGGIGDGRGMMAALALGAEGIEMGTRFIATVECIHANDAYKQALVNGTENETAVIKRTLGSPGRVITNAWAERILALEQQGATYEELKAYISGQANKRYIHEGKTDEGFAWAGQIMGRIHDIPTVHVLVERMIQEAEEIRKQWF